MRINIALIVLLWCGSALAVTIDQKLPDVAQENVAEAAISQLKCVVCEGQSLADSDASFASEMRKEIRRMASEGKSQKEILDYFSAHYGARILMTPPVQENTLLLWLGPLLMLLLGGGLVWRYTREEK